MPRHLLHRTLETVAQNLQNVSGMNGRIYSTGCHQNVSLQVPRKRQKKIMLQKKFQSYWSYECNNFRRLHSIRGTFRNRASLGGSHVCSIQDAISLPYKYCSRVKAIFRERTNI